MSRKHLTLLPVFALAALFTASAFTADPPAPAKPSTYAPAKDAIAQVEFYLGRIGEDLADAGAYGDEQKQRILKDANTLAVLGALLGMHDEQHAHKAGGPALVAAAKEIAKSTDDHAKATAALEKAKQALKATSGGGKLGWENVADLAQLMKQVPIVNNSLRAGVTGARFDRLKEKTAQTAATLAAIAEASAYDSTYVSDKADTEAWQKICFEMRDATAAVAKATRAGDQATAKKELDRVVLTCDACHNKFRDGK
jgi:hypothetical protein